MHIASNIVDAVKTANAESRRPPVPVRWREKVEENKTAKWTFKRNYKASFITENGVITGYAIHEVYDRPKANPILVVTNATKLVEDTVKTRCEAIIRTLAKGYDLKLTGLEKDKGVYTPENIRFIPYETSAVA